MVDEQLSLETKVGTFDKLYPLFEAETIQDIPSIMDLGDALFDSPKNFEPLSLSWYPAMVALYWSRDNHFYVKFGDGIALHRLFRNPTQIFEKYEATLRDYELSPEDTDWVMALDTPVWDLLSTDLQMNNYRQININAKDYQKEHPDKQALFEFVYGGKERLHKAMDLYIRHNRFDLSISFASNDVYPPPKDGTIIAAVCCFNPFFSHLSAGIANPHTLDGYMRGVLKNDSI